MVGRQCHRLAQVVGPFIGGLPRQREHQVDVDAGETRRADAVVRPVRPARRVCLRPSASSSAGWKLCTPSETRVTPASLQGHQPLAVTEPGRQFHGPLLGCSAGARPHRGGKPREVARRRAGPGSRRPRRPSPPARPREQRGLRLHTLQEAPDGRRCGFGLVEGAEVAGRGAERHVHVEPKGRRSQLWLALCAGRSLLGMTKLGCQNPNTLIIRMHTIAFPAGTVFSWLGAAAALALLPGCATVDLTNLTPSSLAGESPRRSTPSPCGSSPRATRFATRQHRAPHRRRRPELRDGRRARSAAASTISSTSSRRAGPRCLLLPGRLPGRGQRPDLARPRPTRARPAEIVRRYVLSLEGNRGPVGAQVGVLGRGFTPQDVIYFDGTPVRTVFESPTSLSFFVPAVPSGHELPGHPRRRRGKLARSATFRVDPTNVTVTPDLAVTRPGRTADRSPSPSRIPAPHGGLLLDVATDVPGKRHHARGRGPRGQTSVTIRSRAESPATATSSSRAPARPAT